MLPPLLVVAVLPPLLVPVAVAPAAVPALEDGLGVFVGPEPLPPPQYGAQGSVSVESAPVTAVAEARRAMRRC